MSQLKMYHDLKVIEDFPIPEEFELSLFKEGDVKTWVDACTPAFFDENVNVESAFRECMLSQEGLVPERDIYFISRKGGKPEATLTAFVYPDNKGYIHMVAAKPSIQGHNVSRMMLSVGMKKLDKMIQGENRIVYLTTDDFRLPAIVGYLKAGFRPVIYAEGMVERWTKICDQLNMHGYEMFNDDGTKSGVIL